MKRRQKTFKLILALLTVAFLGVSATAQTLSVRNRPYKGEINGRGMGAMVVLSEIAKALEMTVEQTDAGWTLDGQAVVTTDTAGVPYITLSELKAAGLKVTENKDFGTIDVYKPVAKSDAPSKDSWSAKTSQNVMVHFGATW